MKAIKINTVLTTKSGIEIPSGALVVETESYTRKKDIRVREVDGVVVQEIPASVAFLVFKDNAALNAGKAPIMDIDNLETSLSDLWLDYKVYKTAPAETMVIGAIQTELEKKFPGKTEIVEV